MGWEVAACKRDALDVGNMRPYIQYPTMHHGKELHVLISRMRTYLGSVRQVETMTGKGLEGKKVRA